MCRVATADRNRSFHNFDSDLIFGSTHYGPAQICCRTEAAKRLPRRRRVLRGRLVDCAIATQVFPFFDVPIWGVRLVVLAIIIGLSFAVAFAWAYEITPEDVKRTEASRRSNRSRDTPVGSSTS